MAVDMKISVCVPSYRRPKVETLDYLGFAKIFVDRSEEEAYKKENPGANIIGVPDGIQGNVCRIRNYILDYEFFELGSDVCVILDDDLKGVFYWEKLETKKVQEDEFLGFVERYSILAKDWGAYFWGMNVNPDKKTYREYSPFSTVSFIGGPFQAFMKGGGLRYDEKLPLKEDYDMTLQQLNKHRVVLRLNKFFYVAKQSEQIGGCAVYRNYKREEEQLMCLQRKWGSKIVRRSEVKNLNSTKSKEKNFDYNPIIKVPIRGI